MRMQYRDINFRNPSERVPVRIISDAMVATGHIGDGRFIPLLILDENQRPDIAEMIRIHHQVAVPGDQHHQWGRLPGREGTISLVLEFIRPAELKAILNFDIEKQGGVVDAVIRARALYLQSGKDGDRLINTLDKPRILVEIGDLGIDREWEDELRKHLFKRFRRDGMSRAEAKRAVVVCLAEWRKMTGQRMR